MGSMKRDWLVAGVLCLGVALAAVGCGGKKGGGAAVPCLSGTDMDGDNYGPGCEAGDDCNDFDATINIDCCEAGNYAGCPCDPGSDTSESCFEGPSDRLDNSPCRAGTRACDPETAKWGGCGGQILPDLEQCDEVDNDCDSFSDEGVQSACGNCIAGCDNAGVGDDPFPFPDDDPNVDADGVGLDPNGDLILDSESFENNFIWIANDPQGTVLKIDTRTGRQVGRYASVSHEVLINVTGDPSRVVQAWNQGRRNAPSRTAIDYNFDVWVANRAHDGDDNSGTDFQPTATKILNNPAECTDRNGNSQIDTSRDANDDGIIDISDPAEFFAESDECIQMTVIVGSNGGIARALVIDAGIEPGDPGDVWVGMWNEGAFYELNGQTGAAIRRVPPAGSLGISPYGAAIDGQARLWATDGCCTPNARVVAINTITGQVIPNSSNQTIRNLGFDGRYGIVVDQDDRVWVGGWSGGSDDPGGRVHRYDPATGMTVSVPIPEFAPGEGTRRVRGVGIDARGNVWAAVDTETDRMVRIDADSATVTGQFRLPGGSPDSRNPIGIGVDFDGDVWTVNRQGEGTGVSRLHIDETTGEPAPHPVTGNNADNFPTGAGTEPYTYSDFTGLGLRVVTRPSGEYTVPIQGCIDMGTAVWQSVTWDATVPSNTSVEIWVRVGNDLATLDAQPIYGPWTVSPADLTMPPGPVPEGAYLQLTIRLISSDGVSTPIVHGYSVQWSCPAPPVE